jgi:hypothetical protein
MLSKAITKLQYTLTMGVSKEHRTTVYTFTERRRLHGRQHNFVLCGLSINELHDFSIVFLRGSCFSYCQGSSNHLKDHLKNMIQIIITEVQYLYWKMYKISNCYNKCINALTKISQSSNALITYMKRDYWKIKFFCVTIPGSKGSNWHCLEDCSALKALGSM